jgi:hypothetical protein
VSLLRVKHVTPLSALDQTVHVTVALDNLILAVAANDTAPYLVSSSYTQLIDRWHRNPLENRVTHCQQRYEQIVLDSLNQPRCLPHCARDSARDLHVIDRVEGVAVLEDVTPVNIACQTVLSAPETDTEPGPRSLCVHVTRVKVRLRTRGSVVGAVHRSDTCQRHYLASEDFGANNEYVGYSIMTDVLFLGHRRAGSAGCHKRLSTHQCAYYGSGQYQFSEFIAARSTAGD